MHVLIVGSDHGDFDPEVIFHELVGRQTCGDRGTFARQR